MPFVLHITETLFTETLLFQVTHTGLRSFQREHKYTAKSISQRHYVHLCIYYKNNHQQRFIYYFFFYIGINVCLFLYIFLQRNVFFNVEWFLARKEPLCLNNISSET